MSPPEETRSLEERSPQGPAPHASSSFDTIKRSSSSAADAAKKVGRAAAADAKEIGGSIARQAGESVETAKSRLGDSLHRVADTVQHAADGLDNDARWANEALTRGAKALDALSGYVSGHGVNSIIHDGEEFARKNPAAYFAASLAAGFLVARLAKTAAARAGGTRSADWEPGGKRFREKGANNGSADYTEFSSDFENQPGGAGP
jgi:hypothetical protein